MVTAFNSTEQSKIMKMCTLIKGKHNFLYPKNDMISWNLTFSYYSNKQK